MRSEMSLTPLGFWVLFGFTGMCRNACTAADFFGLPPNQVVELRTRVTL